MDDYDTAHGEHDVFDDKLPREGEHREMRSEHELWRADEYGKGADKVENKNGMGWFIKGVTEERESDERFKPAEYEVPHSRSEKRETCVDDVIDRIKSRNFECAEPKEYDADGDTQERDAMFKCFLAVHDSIVLCLSPKRNVQRRTRELGG